MGVTNSKPTTTAVFQGETPVRFSSTLVSTLQSTTETDSTREAALELHIQSRVASELQRLEARESEILARLDQKLLDSKPHEDSGAVKERDQVQKEIDVLRRRLQAIPKLRELEGGMQKARENLIVCLKGNETTPLDCYKEVAEFRDQARRMEKRWVAQKMGRDY